MITVREQVAENLGKNTLGKVNSKHKGPEAGASSAGLRNSKKQCV